MHTLGASSQLGKITAGLSNYDRLFAICAKRFYSRRMQLSCPACSTKFTVDPALLGESGRKVKCSNCGHVWMQAAPNAGSAPAASDDSPDTPGKPAPSPGTVAEEMAKLDGEGDTPAAATPAQDDDLKESSLPDFSELAAMEKKSASPRKNRPALVVGTGVIILVALFIWREGVVHSWPASAKLFEAAGVGVPVAGESLEFQDLSMTQRVSGDEAVYLLEGHIANMSTTIQEVPDVFIEVRDDQNEILHSATVPPRARRILAIESIPFSVELPITLSPEALQKTRVTVTFVKS